jgi:flagellar hook-associated protein 3 FlgL
MRISSEQQFSQGIDAILVQQAKLNETQEQLASGNRILTPSDDPSASTQLIKLSALIASNNQYDRNIVFAQNQIGLSESKLKSAGDILQRVRELVVQANTAIHSNGSRGAIGTEIQNNLDALLDIANSKDASGEYIFSGFNSTTQPFVKEGDGYAYKGDQGERLLRVSEDIRVQVRDSGAEVFQKIKDGDGRLKVNSPDSNQGNSTIFLESNVESVVENYAIEFLDGGGRYEIRNAVGDVVQTGQLDSGVQFSFNDINVTIDGSPQEGDRFEIRPATNVDIFSTLQALSDVLSRPADSASALADLTTHLTQALNEIDQGLAKFLGVRSSLGNRLQQLDVRAAENINANIRYERSVSDLKDLDYAEAVSRLNMEKTGLQAAQQAYVKVQGLSLFNYLR